MPPSLSSVRASVSNTISTDIAGGYGTSCDRTLQIGWFQVRIGSWLVRRMVGGPSPPGDDGLSVGDPAQRDELPEGPMRGHPSAFGWRWSSRASRPPPSSVTIRLQFLLQWDNEGIERQTVLDLFDAPMVREPPDRTTGNLRGPAPKASSATTPTPTPNRRRGITGTSRSRQLAIDRSMNGNRIGWT
jgi:hypothetical protein